MVEETEVQAGIIGRLRWKQPYSYFAGDLEFLLGDSLCGFLQRWNKIKGKERQVVIDNEIETRDQDEQTQETQHLDDSWLALPPSQPPFLMRLTICAITHRWL